MTMAFLAQDACFSILINQLSPLLYMCTGADHIVDRTDNVFQYRKQYG